MARYRCQGCELNFSSHTLRASYRQKRPDLNAVIFKLYASGTTQRRLARVLGINRKTVVRKFLYLARLSREAHEQMLAETRVGCAQFDEMESFEHTRLKPLSIALSVGSSDGKILAAEVGSMPARGKLAVIAFRKYGYRKDERPETRSRALSSVARLSPVRIITDGHPAYPGLVAGCLPKTIHCAVPSRMGRRFRPEGSRRNVDDALFALNHTSAKIRHDLSRMMRKVWVTTKKASRLQAHLDLYIAFNNGYLLPR